MGHLRFKLPTRIKEIWGCGLDAFHSQLQKWLKGFHPSMKSKMDLHSNSLFSPLWMLHKTMCFSLAQISHKSTCKRKFKVEAGTSIHNSHCQGERIGGKDLKGIFCVSGKNWTEGFCQSSTTLSHMDHVSVTDQHATALIFNGLHSQMPASES